MFEKNTLTVNRGWAGYAGNRREFTDVRELQGRLMAPGVELMAEADESTKGPAGFVAIDPAEIRSWSIGTSAFERRLSALF